MDLVKQKPKLKLKVRRIDLLPNYLKYLGYFILFFLSFMYLNLLLLKRNLYIIFCYLIFLIIVFFVPKTYIVYENGIKTKTMFLKWKDFEKIEWKEGKLYLYRKQTKTVLPDPNKVIYSLIRK